MHVPALGPRGEGWLAGQLVLFVAIWAAGWLNVAGPDASAPGSSWPPTLQLVAGALAMVAGGLLAVRGTVDLGANLTPFPRPRRGATLVEDGVYRYIRHPIYSGLVLAGAGWSIATGSWLALVLTAALLGLFDLKSRREEAWLVAQLPGYEAYRGRTRKFVPGVY